MRYLLDTSAWIEYFEGGTLGKKVWEIIEDEESEIFTLSIIIAEVISKFEKINKDVDAVYNSILSNSSVLELDPSISKEAGILYVEMRKKINSFGLIDALIISSAKNSDSILVTKDPHFKSFKNIVFLS